MSQFEDALKAREALHRQGKLPTVLITVKRQVSESVNVDELTLSDALFRMVAGRLELDEAPDRLLTDGDGNTYGDGSDWQLSTDPRIAMLVDAANVLRYGMSLSLESEE